MTWALLPLTAEASLERVGGKALNLMRMTRAGLPVPSGFVVPTEAYRAFVDKNSLEKVIVDALADLNPKDHAGLEAASARVRDAFRGGCCSAGLDAAIVEAWREMGAPPVAVRSSATTEDLPDLSFAGQQETFLNVTTPEALLEAVVSCWASLWTARAIGYRARVGIPPHEAALAVVVQEMVPADVSGVLFTANPLTGKRTETVIEATLGLGEALVSGRVEPDRYVVVREGERWRVVEKKLGAKTMVIRPKAEGGTEVVEAPHADRLALPDAVVLRLAEWGARVQALFGHPQDVEWAVLDPGGEVRVWLLQSRPITSLYPLPENLPLEPLRVLVGLHLIQGIHEPLTPLGREVLMRLLLAAGRIFGLDVTPQEQTLLWEAGERLWINVAALLRHRVVRRIFPRFLGAVDPPTARLIRGLLDNPRLRPERTFLPPRYLGRALRFAGRALRTVLSSWRDPEAVRTRYQSLIREAEQDFDARLRRTMEATDPWQGLAAALDLLPAFVRVFPEVIIPWGFPLTMAGMLPFALILQREARRAARALNDPGLATLAMEISRGLPHNVTTEMDLALWEVARRLQQDPEAAAWVQEHDPDALAAAWAEGRAPTAVREALTPFLEAYGLRGVGEIDIGRPRWTEDPRQVFRTLQGYPRITDPDQAPDAVFARGAARAAEAQARLEAAVRRLPGGRLRARVVCWAATRYRALGGTRETHKFVAAKRLGRLRQVFLAVDRRLYEQGELERPEDIFYLTTDELARCARDRRVFPEMREAIRERRKRAEREARRQRLPRVLFSDGTAFYEGPAEAPTAAEEEGRVLRGDPVSPGVAEGTVKVVHNPHEADLQPGDILVCHGTDPAWTPLFLVAGGLVMEVGGMMTHGAVVAREYGIPAVVGVHDATRRLRTRQRVRVDGSQGVVTVLSG